MPKKNFQEVMLFCLSFIRRFLSDQVESGAVEVCELKLGDMKYQECTIFVTSLINTLE